MNQSEHEINMLEFLCSIRLENLKEADTGFYTCEISNGFESKTSTGFVRLKNLGK